MSAPLINEIMASGTIFAESKDEAARQRLIASASSLIQELENPGEQMARIGWGEPSRTAALRTAFELGLLQKLADVPLDSERLAAGTKAERPLVCACRH